MRATSLRESAAWAALLCFALAGAAAQRLTLFGNENSQPEREVGTCHELKAALLEKVLSVAVVGDITCTRAQWGNPVRINWNVEIFGRVAPQGERLMPVLDWADVRKGLVVQKGAVLFIHTLQLRQDSMGIGGIDLAFIETSKGATGVFSGVVVGVRSCPQPVVAYNEIAGSIPRPDFLIGEQRTSAVDDTTLLVEDIAIWWPEINSLWQICHAAFLCGEDLKSPGATLGAQKAIFHTTCVAQPDAERLHPAQRGGEGGGESYSWVWMLLLGVGLTVFFFAASAGFLYLRKRACTKVRVQDTPHKDSAGEAPEKDLIAKGQS